MRTISQTFNSPKEQTDNHTDNILHHLSSKSQMRTRDLTCPIAIENSFSNQNLYGLNLWICFVIIVTNIAHDHFQQARLEVNYQLDKHGN